MCRGRIRLWVSFADLPAAPRSSFLLRAPALGDGPGRHRRVVLSVASLGIDAEIANPGPEQARFLKALREFETYVRANAGSIPNYGERHRAGETISSSMAESAVNQVISKRMVKKQQMRWSPRRAHMLVQLRTRALNDTLADDFRRWYPGFTRKPKATPEDQSEAA